MWFVQDGYVRAIALWGPNMERWHRDGLDGWFTFSGHVGMTFAARARAEGQDPVLIIQAQFEFKVQQSIPTYIDKRDPKRAWPCIVLHKRR